MKILSFFVICFISIHLFTCVNQKKKDANEERSFVPASADDSRSQKRSTIEKNKIETISRNRLEKENLSKQKKFTLKSQNKLRIIRAEALIEEKIPRTRNKIKTQLITLLGKAQVRISNHVLNAPRIQIRNLRDVSLPQGFHIYDRKSGVSLKGRKGELDVDEGVFSLRKRIIFSNNRNKNLFQIYGNEATRFLRVRKTLIKGNLRLKTQNSILRGKLLIQDDARTTVMIYGRPTMRRKRLTVRADLIEFQYAKNRLTFLGKVTLRQGKFRIEAGEIVYFLQRANEFYLKDEIRFEDGERIVVAKELYFQKKKEMKLIAKGGVQMTDKENNMGIQADTMIWNNSSKELNLRGDATLEFLEKNARTTLPKERRLIVQGETIIRKVRQGKTEAYGKVSARFKEKFFSAQILDYDEKSDTMILEGNPKIQETGLQIQATKILFYPNREQMTLSHDAKVEIKTNE